MYDSIRLKHVCVSSGESMLFDAAQDVVTEALHILQTAQS